MIDKRDIMLVVRTDVHQHIWSEPLLEALAGRSELPFVRFERGLTVLYLAGERPYVIDRDEQEPQRRTETVEADGLDCALVCLSSPIGIEALDRAQAEPLLDAYHEGAVALGGPFGAWGALALDHPDPCDLDAALGRGCVGISLPADALASVRALAELAPLFERLEEHDAPLLVHPGPAPAGGRVAAVGAPSLCEPLWWPAMTRYPAGVGGAWLAFQAAGRPRHPRLRVIFSMLAGLAPLHCERLAVRGGPERVAPDPLTFYETSSYGPSAIAWISELVGAEQILYGSDRPVIEPSRPIGAVGLDWDLLAHSTGRALGAGAGALLP
jgi:6-methylsalicylate decarboxylase